MQPTTKPKVIYDLTDVDFCVFTTGNREALEQLLDSIVTRYPAARLVVADNSYELDRQYYKSLMADLAEKGLLNRMYIHRVPYGCDWQVARNFLATHTPKKYKLFIEDEFVFGDDTDVLGMVTVLEEHPSVGIVVGAVNDAKGLLHDKDIALDDKHPLVFRTKQARTRFMLVHIDVMGRIRFESGDNELVRFSMLLPTQVPFAMVALPSAVIFTQDEKPEVTDDSADTTQTKEPTGASDGDITKQPVQGNDAGQQPAGNSVPSGQAKTETGKNTTGGQGGGSARPVRGQGN